MRFWFSGPRIAGIRPGISFGREDFAGFASQPTSAAGAIDPDHSFLYVIKNDHGLCKIGQTTNPTARLAQLRTASAVPLELAWVGAPKNETLSIERDAHTMLDKYRQNGEWFALSPDAAVGAIHAAAFRRGQPVLDLDATQADKIVQVAMNQPVKKPITFLSLFDRLFWLIVKMVLGTILGVIIAASMWLLVEILKTGYGS